MIRVSISSSLPCSVVVSPSLGLSSESVDGHLGLGLGDALPEVPSSGPLVRVCGYPSPYRCGGAHGPSHLPSDFPSPSASPRFFAWWTDSSTALAYIRKRDGTVTRPLLLLSSDILLLAHRQQLRFLPIFVPSEENLLADRASRFETLPDWHLHPSVFQLIVGRWGLPVIDLFATESSAQVRRFFAWGRAPHADAFDALAQVWEFPVAYAFPPPPLLPRVVRKIAASIGVFLLVTPFWPAQKWYPALLGLRVEEVCRLPEVPGVVDLVSGAPPLLHLPLLAWKIIGGCTVSPSPTTPSASFATAGEPLPRRAMTPCGALSAPFSTPAEFLSFPSI